MNALTRVSLKNPIAIFILSFLLIISGTMAFQSLKVDLLPNIELPQLSIEAVYPGASPDVIEKQVTSQLESQLKNVEGVDQITSQTFESVAMIQLTFPFDTDMDAAQQKVEDLIGQAALPPAVKPEISRFSFGSFPIVNAAITAKGNTDVQKLLEEEIRPELEKLPGVNSVAVGGTAKELITITLNKEQALRSGLTLSKVQDAIKGAYLSMPAGTVVNDSILVPIRVEESLDTVADLESLQITETLKLRDIATIQKTSSKPEIIRYNDQESIALTVTKKQDANTVELADQALAVLDSYKDQIDYGLVLNQADTIKKSVESLIKEGLLGALFASLAVLLFLRNIRATIIAVLSIPLSLLVSAVFLAQADITLNVMTLGGMAVAVGRVVDDSIVVIENIFRRMKNNREGLEKRELTIAATAEMLKAITSSTLTTIVVFLPLGFVGGITGEFFLPFALTIVFALLTSLLVSITLTPVLANLSFAKVAHEEKEDALQRFYARVIEASLKRKWVVYAVSLVLLVGSLSLTSQLGFVFLPNESQKLVSATVTLPPSTVLSKTNDVSLAIEQMLKERDTVKTVFAGIGSRNAQTGLKQENSVSYFISLTEEAVVQEEVDAIEANISEIVKQAAEKSTVSVMEMSTGGPPSNNNVNIDLYSNDPDKLLEASQQVEEFLSKREDLRYITNNMREKQKTWVVEIDPQKASDSGVSAFTVLGVTADQTRPVSVGTLTLDGTDQSVELTYDRPLASKGELEDLTLFGAKGPVKLKEIAAVKEVDAISTIQKFDAKVFARVSATIDAPNVQAVSADTIAAVKAGVDLPDGVSLEAGGGSDETTQTFKDLGLAMLVAVGLVYLVMLFTFGQARVPIIILTSLLFVPVGAILGLYVMNEPLSISAMIGVLMLIGIVVTNAIVLVDRIGQNRDSGLTIRDSLIEAGKTRLRPILMTAFATICALIPLALTSAEGNVISKGLAVVVIGGLLFATLLTLVIVPVTYELFFLRTHRKEQAEATK